jgi:hypothetical protein
VVKTRTDQKTTTEKRDSPSFVMISTSVDYSEIRIIYELQSATGVSPQVNYTDRATANCQ